MLQNVQLQSIITKEVRGASPAPLIVIDYNLDKISDFSDNHDHGLPLTCCGKGKILLPLMKNAHGRTIDDNRAWLRRRHNVVPNRTARSTLVRISLRLLNFMEAD